MKPENAIEVKNVEKKFKVFLDKGHTLKELTLFSKRRKYEERTVLDGISFEVKKGEAVGLIGHNGCGKSTTLKLLTRIMYPDSGTIEMSGRVSSLIELGAGFHPDMSGRQNIYTNASIFGLTRKEIDERLNDIIAFSELEEFIDNPVRTYSSGMYMRLAFSVAINVDADILLIDEILAVGDANFQAKCFNKLREIKANGTTIVIVSHSLGQIEQICERSIWIHNGQIRAEGAPRDVHPEYMDFMGQKRQDRVERKTEPESQKESTEQQTDEKQNPQENKCVEDAEPLDDKKKRWGNGKAKIRKITIMDVNHNKKETFKTGDTIILDVAYDVKIPVEDAIFGIGIFRVDGTHCYGTNTEIDKLDRFDLKNSGKIEIELKQLQLLPGQYEVDLAIHNKAGEMMDYCSKIARIEMFSVYDDVGICRVEHEWRFIDEKDKITI